MTMRPDGRLGLLAAALCLGAASTAQAINIDQADAGLGFGDGSGELFFSIIDLSRSESFILDMNLPVADFVANSSSLAGSYSVTSSPLAAWLAGGDLSQMSWNIAGVNNVPDATQFFTLTSVDPDSGFVLPPDPTNVQSAVNSAGQYVGAANTALIADAGGEYGIFGTADGLAYMFGGAWGFNWGGQYGFDNAPEIGQTTTLWRVDATLAAEEFTAGFFELDVETGTLGYSVIPVPAAVWLFGSALGVLGAMRRRLAARA